MKGIDDFFADQNKKNTEGTLTVGEAVFGYYRLLEGVHAGKVIIKTTACIDSMPIIYFANGLTWCYEHKLEDIRCERIGVTFSSGNHPIDRSKATWYSDSGIIEQNHEW